MGCTAQHPGPPGLCLQRPTPISIFEDRIEFVTIGGLAKGIGLCKEISWVVRKDVGAALGVSQATAILLLREMTRDRLLEKRGLAKNLRYYLAGA